jgi:hypothetical protein
MRDLCLKGDISDEYAKALAIFQVCSGKRGTCRVVVIIGHPKCLGFRCRCESGARKGAERLGCLAQDGLSVQ